MQCQAFSSYEDESLEFVMIDGDHSQSAVENDITKIDENNADKDVFIETIIKTGDIVLLPAMGPTKVDYKGEEYYTIQENQILAVIENE